MQTLNVSRTCHSGKVAPSFTTGDSSQLVAPPTEPAVVVCATPEASVQSRLTFICAQLLLVRRATNRNVGVAIPTHTGGDTASPVGSIDSERESLAPCTWNDSLAAIVPAPLSDHPDAPVSNEPFGAIEYVATSPKEANTAEPEVPTVHAFAIAGTAPVNTAAPASALRMRRIRGRGMRYGIQTSMPA